MHHGLSGGQQLVLRGAGQGNFVALVKFAGQTALHRGLVRVVEIGARFVHHDERAVQFAQIEFGGDVVEHGFQQQARLVQLLFGADAVVDVDDHAADMGDLARGVQDGKAGVAFVATDVFVQEFKADRGAGFGDGLVQTGGGGHVAALGKVVIGAQADKVGPAMTIRRAASLANSMV